MTNSPVRMLAWECLGPLLPFRCRPLESALSLEVTERLSCESCNGCGLSMLGRCCTAPASLCATWVVPLAVPSHSEGAADEREPRAVEGTAPRLLRTVLGIGADN